MEMRIDANACQSLPLLDSNEDNSDGDSSLSSLENDNEDRGGEREPSEAMKQHLRTRFHSSEKQCRICLESEETDDNRLIAPCRCTGSSKYVHRDCLQQWRCTRRDTAWSRCTVCLQSYVLVRPEARDAPGTVGKYSKFLSLVAFDFGSLFIAIQLLLGILSFYLYMIDMTRMSDHVMFGLFGETTTQLNFEFVCWMMNLRSRHSGG